MSCLKRTRGAFGDPTPVRGSAGACGRQLFFADLLDLVLDVSYLLSERADMELASNEKVEGRNGRDASANRRCGGTPVPAQWHSGNGTQRPDGRSWAHARRLLSAL